MPETDAKPRRRRSPLSAERIAAEAMALIDEEGLDALSFRALGKRLRCEAMSLYHYYPSKAHLIDALVNICLAEIPLPPDDLSVHDWMREFCHRYRATALRHPAFVPILTTHRLNHREGLTKLEAIARVLDRTGLPCARQAALFRVLSYFLTGAVIDEALGYAKGPSATEPVPAEEARAEFPGIMALGGYFGKAYHERFFEIGLDLILDWIEAEIAAGQPGG